MEPVEITARLLWEFPGGTVVFLITVTCAALLLAASYFLTLRRLRLHQRLLLLLAELLLYTLLLFLLGNPSREETRKLKIDRPVRTALIFDTSGSMRIPGLIGKTRLEEARETAAKLRLPADGKVDYYALDETFRKLDSADDLPMRQTVPTANSHLLEQLPLLTAELLRNHVQCAVLFSDGADNGGNGSEAETTTALAESGIKFFIVPTRSEVALRRFLELRKFEAPGKAILNAIIPIEAAVTYSNLSNSDLVELEIVDAQGKSLFRETGRRQGTGGTLFFHAELTLPTLGKQTFQTKLLLNGQTHRSFNWQIETIRRSRKRIFLYQGTHDWAVRFLKRALSDGKSDLIAQRYRPELPEGGFPSQEKLNEFDTVVLLNLRRAQTSAVMERELLAYLRQGGGVLFITGNPAAAGEFSRSHLEELLPVRFSDKAPRDRRADAKTSEFKRQIRNYTRGTNMHAENFFLRQQEHRYEPTPLKRFTLTPGGKAHPVFRGEEGRELLPCFDDFAMVKSVKPGAEVLAVYQDGKKGDQVLFAVQRFGRGRSAVLATDPLWRWKLSLPSHLHDSELFWNNLLGWLGNSGKLDGAAWHLSNRYLAAGETLHVTLTGAAESPPVSQLIHDGTSQELRLPQADANGVQKFQLAPHLAGHYTLSLKELTTEFTVTTFTTDRELDAAAPDPALLKRLGSVPGARFCPPGTPIDLSAECSSIVEYSKQKRVEPLWPHGRYLWMLLGLWGLTLILRRIWRMV